MNTLNCFSTEKPLHVTVASPIATIVLTTSTMKMKPTSIPNRVWGTSLPNDKSAGQCRSIHLTNRAYRPRMMAAATTVKPGYA